MFKDLNKFANKENLLQFWPSKYQTYEERINSITRFILYAGGLIAFYNKKTSPLTFSFLLIALLAIISSTKNKVLKKILLKKENCQKPTAQNPMGNQIPFDDINRKKGCNSFEVTDQITSSLLEEFPTVGLGDKNKEYMNRQFFTTANSNLINDQKGFASWLYGAPNKKMCKSDPSSCTGFDGNPGYSGDR